MMLYSQLLLAKLLWLPIVLVFGDYTLEVTVQSYSLDTGFFGCCDDDRPRGSRNTCTRCNTYFQYCLLPFGTTTSSRQPLTCAPIASSIPSGNGAFIDFSQSTVLGLPNPLVFNGISSSWTGVLLQVVATDFDPSSADDLIDVFRANLVNREGSVVLSGTYDLATFAFSYRVICKSGFYGDMCQHFDDCPSIDLCGPNGVCVDGDSTFTCQCDPGFTGSTCLQSIDDCIGVTCSGHGRCVDEMNAYTCVCDAGYTGGSCNVNIDDCVGANCGENGQCVDGINSYTCVCDAGYTGRSCNVNINDCIGAICGENGQCVDGVNTITCMCDPGFTGDWCEANINDCTDNSCSGNGDCMDGVNSFSCECVDGYVGEFCETLVVEQTSNCSGANCTKGLGARGGGGGEEQLMFVLIIGGSLGGFVLLLCLVAFCLVVAICCVCRKPNRKNGRDGTELGPMNTAARQSMTLTNNIGYGCGGEERSFADEAIYEYVGNNVIGSRRHGVYGGNVEDMDSHSIYDAVL